MNTKLFASSILAASLMILTSCAAPTSKFLAPNSPLSVDVTDWSAVKLTDLEGQPVITTGRSADDKTTYISIQTADSKMNYRIEASNAQTAELTEVAEFATANPRPLDVKSFARDVQASALYDQYEKTWRCRGSQSWSRVASRDLKKQGPLLLNLPQVNSSLRIGFDTLIAIDQATFKVVGISGTKVSSALSGGQPYYVSSVTGDNYVFGLTSSATVLNTQFHASCMDSYLSYLPAAQQDPQSRTARSFNPLRDNVISSRVDLQARLRHEDLENLDRSYYIAQPFGADEQKSLTPKFDLNEMESLIKTAASAASSGAQ